MGQDESNSAGLAPVRVARALQIAPSIACADWSRLAEHLKALEQLPVDFLHCDVMDGRFVPNITFGAEIQAKLHEMTQVPIDTHLMIEDPDRYVESFVRAGSKRISIHVEAARHLDRTLRLIASLGAVPAVALNPATPLSAIPAARALAEKSAARFVVMKLGALGALVLSEGRATHVPPFTVTAVDPTAAGDAFTAALALHWLTTNDILEATRYGNAAGALAASRLGAQPSLPDWAAVSAFQARPIERT